MEAKRRNDHGDVDWLRQSSASSCLVAHAVLARKNALQDGDDGVKFVGVIRRCDGALVSGGDILSKSRASCSVMILEPVRASRSDSQMPKAAVPSASGKRTCWAMDTPNSSARHFSGVNLSSGAWNRTGVYKLALRRLTRVTATGPALRARPVAPPNS